MTADLNSDPDVTSRMALGEQFRALRRDSFTFVLLFATCIFQIGASALPADFTLETAQAAAQQQDPDALYFLARACARGLGLKQDYTQAAQYLRQAADCGHVFAANDLAALYARGLGVEQDYAKAARWYRQAAERGDALAQYSLGHIYSIGRGVEKDLSAAVYWWRRAAEQNQPEAQNALGQHFFWAEVNRTNSSSISTNKNLEAFKWLSKAAEQGQVTAMNNLAYLYDHGLGVEANTDQAVAWYRKAAEAGNAKAQGNLGLLCQDGKGVAKDQVEAYKWFLLSSAGGDSIGRRYAQEYIDKALLTPEQFAEAERQAAEFRSAKRRQNEVPQMRKLRWRSGADREAFLAAESRRYKEWDAFMRTQHRP